MECARYLENCPLDTGQCAGLIDCIQQFGGKVFEMGTPVPQEEVPHTGVEAPPLFLLVVQLLEMVDNLTSPLRTRFGLDVHHWKDQTGHLNLK
jgi:hypothetical protein